MESKPKKLNQKELECRVILASDLFRCGKIERIEMFRIELDYILGVNTKDLEFKNNSDFEENIM